VNLKYKCNSCNKEVAENKIKNKPSLFYKNYCIDCGVRCNYCQISLKILGFTKETVLNHTKVCKEKEIHDNNQNDYYWDDPVPSY
jgi:predicted peroxiredoxin